MSRARLQSPLNMLAIDSPVLYTYLLIVDTMYHASAIHRNLSTYVYQVLCIVDFLTGATQATALIPEQKQDALRLAW